jgi:hypothetical protein
MDETKLKEDQTRAWKAQELLDNELLKDALAAIKSEVVSQWESCPARDKEGKEALWQLYKTTNKLESVLYGYVQTGKLAAENLSRFEQESKIKQLRRVMGM